jgi:hypothetical protein
MGILRLKVEANNADPTTTTTSTTTLGEEVSSKRNTADSTTTRTAAAATTWGRCRITWVTISGWLLSTVLESSPPNNNGSGSIKQAMMIHSSFYQVLHAPPKVQYRNADGDLIPPTTNTMRHNYSSWSLPADPIAVDKTHSNHLLCCWSDVPAVTNILPHHDQYVLDSQPRVVRSQQRALLYRTITNNGTSTTTTQQTTMTLPVSKAPQAIAVHPGGGPHLEWIVMGVDHRLVLMAGRRS